MIYSACLCFGLNMAEQARSGFAYSYSIYQAEYSRNLLFASSGQMQDLFGRVLDCTRSRLDIPALRVLFGLKSRPHPNRAAGPPAQEIVIEKSQHGLAWFRIRLGLLQLKAHIKGEHVLRFEATVHNTKQLRCRRSLDNFPEITTRLAGMAERFATALDCADISFLNDSALDELPLPSRVGVTRVGAVDLNKPRTRAALAAALALAAAPHGFTVAEHAAKVQAMAGHDGYTIRQAAYDLRKLRGKGLAVKPGHHPPLPHPGPGSPRHRRPARPARPGHRPHPRRHPQPPPRTQTRHLDPHRPGLRDPPHRHAGPLPRPRHHRQPRRRIDNILQCNEVAKIMMSPLLTGDQTSLVSSCAGRCLASALSHGTRPGECTQRRKRRLPPTTHCPVEVATPER